MNAAFADTLYWIAVCSPLDAWRASAIKARTGLGEHRIVTTDEVLIEFLNALSRGGPILKRTAVEMVVTILSDESVTVLPQSRGSFEAGVDLYRVRLDKSYSLTDCISMASMRAHGLRDVLTNDHHFAQEGFNVLIKR